MQNLAQSKQRVRDHGEVFTPDFIVKEMLELVYNETQRIQSRFLEPACGDGNFLIKILEMKLNKIEKDYKKFQFEYEKYSLLAVSSIYGIELLEDNALKARDRLYNYYCNKYTNLYRKKIHTELLLNIKYLLGKNVIQGDALTLLDSKGDEIIFSEWSLVSGVKIKRRDFKFKDLGVQDEADLDLFSKSNISDNGKLVIIPIPVKEYPLVNFMEIYKTYEQ